MGITNSENSCQSATEDEQANVNRTDAQNDAERQPEHANDQVFQEEQAHLTETYAKLQRIEGELAQKVDETQREAAQDMTEMRGDVSLDFSDDENTLETVAQLESMNRIIDGYNRSVDVNTEQLRRARLLLRQPYFAKVSLQFKPGQPEREIYLGTAGMTDETCRHFIVDWRSPVAEVYYNQANGPTSYEANGRTINVDLKLRRQFDITRDKLNDCFDTTVAIEDPLLLKALSGRHSEKLHAITATIQKEQNEVVRHADVPVLLVAGIAGSGKTSVLLQRIAYLFYRERDELSPDQVYLFTPNPVFERYIDNVLPDMGERNPHILTWRDFIEWQGVADRGSGESTPASTLLELEKDVPNIEFELHDFKDIVVDGTRIIKAQQIQGAMQKFSRIPTGPRLIALVNDDLHERAERRLSQMAHTEAVQDEMLALDIPDQIEIFGQNIQPENEKETVAYAQQYVNYRYASVFDEIEAGNWLRYDRIGMRLLGRNDLTAVEWLYLKTLITGAGERHARYVMIDEVQDYTEAQLMVLARFFNNAHFLLLGDENQAIKEGTATFPQIKAIFERTHNTVDECKLLTSYRSSPEITELFTSLMDEEDRGRTHSVQHAGIAPRIESFTDDNAYLAALRSTVETAKQEEGLTAIVAESNRRVKWIARQLEELGLDVPIMDEHAYLPESGVILISLPLAKGLEFDHVVLADAQEATFPDTPLSRRRLYTVLSRATHKVTVLAQGPLTPLLKQQAEA